MTGSSPPSESDHANGRRLILIVDDEPSVRAMVHASIYVRQARYRVVEFSQRMLAVTLRHLERDGLVSRRVFATNPPQVEYALTDLGRSLVKPIGGLADWAGDNHGKIRTARKSYDAATAN